MNRRNKGRVLIALSAVSLAASSFLFYKAETARRVTYDAWVKEISHGFTIYPTYDHRWFTEDFFALAFFMFATAALIYGFWLKKSSSPDDIEDGEAKESKPPA